MSRAAYRERLDAAFAAAPRELFLPGSQRRFAGTDVALPIGHEQTNSQPSTVREMLVLLDVPVAARVLDVGSGSGWSTALLAHLVGPGGEVYGVERVADLVESSRASLAGLQVPWARVEHATRELGRPAGSPYDRILVSAGAAELPDGLVRQLATHGIMVVPVAGRMARVRRDRDAVHVTWHGHYRFVPLVL
jgi:protein-L-isoaspartate(D-aspartate) O-methyltransferase